MTNLPAKPIRRLLIANRGEIAVRIVRACRELGVYSVAAYSEADRDSLAVQMADDAVCVGPAHGRDSYMNMPNVIMAALMTQCDAVHPGYGYLSENAAFAEACLASGLVFVGPPSQAIQAMGDKAAARELARHSKVPVVPGTRGAIREEAEVIRQAKQIGYPLLIKAAAGGGGKGIRLVRYQDELSEQFRNAQAEAAAAFGSSDVFLERCIEEPRHIEFQILADGHGNAIHLGERDCSLQTPRRQKMLEEAPSPVLNPKLRNRMGAAAVRLTRTAGYVGAGTIEFLLEGEDRYYFIEMNTRIQVEHGITEMLTDIDLVQWQIRIASGEKLSIAQGDVRHRGHTFELRVTAEDPDNNLTPTAGRIDRLILPGGPGVRVDTHLYPGYTVPPYYDSLLLKLMVRGADRPSAVARAQRALSELVIEGVRTNAPLLARVLADPDFQAGRAHTGFLARFLGSA